MQPTPAGMLFTHIYPLTHSPGHHSHQSLSHQRCHPTAGSGKAALRRSVPSSSARRHPVPPTMMPSITLSRAVFFNRFSRSSPFPSIPCQSRNCPFSTARLRQSRTISAPYPASNSIMPLYFPLASILSFSSSGDDAQNHPCAISTARSLLVWQT